MTPLGDRLLDLALARRGRLVAGSRLVCVDGFAGSGKTTAAGLLHAAAGSRGLRATVVHMDDLYAGWSGLPHLHEVTVPLVRGLAEAGRATYRRHDWERGARAEEHVVEAGDLVVLEGVGSADPAYDDVVTLRVLVTAPLDERLRRGLARDGEAMRERWLRWQEAEAAHLELARTAERADVVVDGLTGRVTPA
ncbi:4-amino-4-deoxy-L-arabinose transferase [Nocardioides marmoribigeumensis]|uniref:Uridine kinase n=1 Tax=Nocardioides marmoribigeumensis TaxID=433649 RepID=A0ABU2BQQ4_9ACTN|nr:4-amino-4-deoxy-L-arabinose transferase [Nocardioides marmoribigeumensis]MDR7360970.1 uridine kinase [Nocardioides marmoribigeumensis]